MLLPVVLFTLLVAINGETMREAAKRIYVGVAVNPNGLSNSAYANTASTQFSCITPENEMKWQPTENAKGTFNYGGADKEVQFAQNHTMKIRGHALVWHAQAPSYIDSLKGNKAGLQEAIDEHITGIVTHMKGKLYCWDVVNEAFNEDGTYRASEFYNTLGKNFIPDAFKKAHSIDSTVKLYYNDYNIEPVNAKSTGVYNMVKEMLAAGVPIHGVGFQSHFSLNQIPSTFKQNLERFAALGVEVAITELDIKASGGSLDQQAKDYASVFKTCMDVPKCVGVTVWGVNDADSWLGESAQALLFKNNQPKAAVAAIIKVLG